jgi:hypothetical protein
VVVVLNISLPASSKTFNFGLEGGGGNTVAFTGKMNLLPATLLSSLVRVTVPV